MTSNNQTSKANRKSPKLATLVPLGEEQTSSLPRRVASLTFRIDATLSDIVVNQSTIDERLLVSYVEDIVKEEFYAKLVHTERRLSGDNPYLSDAERANLDEYGIIREGQVIKEGDVLLSIVEKELRGLKLGEEKDDSLKATQAQDGMRVEQVYYRERLPSSKENVKETVSIQLKKEHPIRPGDVLIIKGKSLGRVGEIRSNAAMKGVQLLVPERAALRLGLKSRKAVSVGILAPSVEAAQTFVATSGRSIISRQPLSRRYGSAQRVTTPQLQWLHSHQLIHILNEFRTLRSDNVTTLEQYQEFIKGDNWSEIPGKIASEASSASYRHLSDLLSALGVSLRVQRSNGSEEYRIAPTSDAELLKLSNGQVKKPESINYRTYKPEPDGILCEKIFGPEETIHPLRGHIQLDAPIIPIIYRIGKQPILERLLSIPIKKLNGVLFGTMRVIENAGKIEIIPSTKAVPSNVIDRGMDIQAIQYLLNHHLAPGMTAWKKHFDCLFQTVVIVLPVQQRPLVLLDSGNFATADVNDLYRRIINRTNRLSKLRQFQAPAVIVENETRQLQLSVDQLHANKFLLRKHQVNGSEKRPLVDILDLVIGLTDTHSKTVEWSAQARFCVRSIADDHIKVPSRIFDKLKLNQSSPVLITSSKSDGFVALLPEPHAESVFVLSQKAFSRIGLHHRSYVKLILHRLMTAAAIQEGKQLLQGTSDTCTLSSSDDSFLDASNQEIMTDRLVETLFEDRVFSMTSPQGLLIRGA